MRTGSLVVFLLLVGFVAGCAQQDGTDSPQAGSEQTEADGLSGAQEDERVSPEEVREKLSEAGDAVRAYSKQETQAALEQARGHLAEVKQKIALLREDVKTLQGSAQEKFQKSVENLDEQLKEAEGRLAALRDAGEETWNEAEDDLQGALEELEQAYDDAADALEANKKEMGTSEGDAAEGAEDASAADPAETEPATGSAEQPPTDG